MGKIFINELSIQNYKCFIDQSIEFGVPDGKNEGSGLNILIGENGNGKTSILEAINYLTQSSFSTENKLQINDFNDHKKEIVIIGETDSFECGSTIDYYSSYKFLSKGLQFSVHSRERKARGKLLSSTFEIKNQFIVPGKYIKPDGSEPKEVDGRDKLFNNGSILGDDEINIFYFDKNRTRQLSIGNFRTTFESICDDLNWKFLKNLDDQKYEELVKNINGEYFTNVLEMTQKGVGRKVAKELKEFFDKNEYERIKIELLNLLHPFSNAFFALKEENSLSQIKTKDLGSGVEMIFTLLLLRNIASESRGSVIYLIDEPELHLHPKAQSKLLELLLEESKTKQIVVSTHSPYIFKDCLSHATRLLVFSRSNKGTIDISDARAEGWKIFPWSPSWGEINYKVFDLPTIEFHNELYGYAQETKKSMLDGLNKNKIWKNKATGKDENVSLSTYIRHSMHHPENQNNPKYTEAELVESIGILIGICSPST